ncbi:MAG: leucine-rich repeat domain-containing protein [Lachnospiraceae bacterium]|nr:leucine-rich repeat domain-containing protein [Lachnospiraceae bacterium]
MMRINKIVSLLLVFTFVVVGINSTIIHDTTEIQAETFDCFTYEVQEDDTIKITSCQIIRDTDMSYIEDLVIPAQINGKKVTRIGSYAFSNLPSDILNITIQSGITTIDSYAFANCDSIYSLAIPDTVTDIGEKAFLNCKELGYINIPRDAKVAADAFEGCDKLKIDDDIETAVPQTETTAIIENSTTIKSNETSSSVPITEKSTTRVTVGKTKITKFTKKFISAKATVKLKTISGSKYEIKVSTTRSFKKNNTITKKFSKATFTIKDKKLKNKKTLYIKVRAYKVIDGKNYPGEWSKIKIIRVKK